MTTPERDSEPVWCPGSGQPTTREIGYARGYGCCTACEAVVVLDPVLHVVAAHRAPLVETPEGEQP